MVQMSETRTLRSGLPATHATLSRTSIASSGPAPSIIRALSSIIARMASPAMRTAWPPWGVPRDATVRPLSAMMVVSTVSTRMSASATPLASAAICA